MKSNKGFNVLHIPKVQYDPISTIDLYDNQVLIGTLNGYAYYSDIALKSNITLLELAKENITGVIFGDDNLFFISIGDYEICKYNITEHTPKLKTIIKISEDESRHRKTCDTNFCFLSKKSFLLLHTSFGKQEEPIIPISISYEKKIMGLPDVIIENTIDITNFSIPFDYDGDKYIWIEYTTPTTQRICVFSTVSQKMEMQYKIPQDFGHVSHMKFVPQCENKVFLVRKNNICEVRQLTGEFKVELDFKHDGIEVIAIDIYLGIECDDIKDNTNFKDSNRSNVPIIKSYETDQLKVSQKKTAKNAKVRLAMKDDSGQNTFAIEEQTDLQKYYYSTLDNDGDFNMYHNNKQETVFNIYDMEIEKDLKDKEFFSVGFPYYIKTNLKNYVVTTDHGAFVFNQIPTE